MNTMSPVAHGTNFRTSFSTFHRAPSVHVHPPLFVFLSAPSFLKPKWPQEYGWKLSFNHPQSSISRKAEVVVSCRKTFDPELHYVLELATDSELYDLEKVLFGPSYFSPLLKSLTGRGKGDHIMITENISEREEFISMLESRFLYLAADARSTLRGWRPSYKNVLLNVRKKLNLPCSAKLSTEDLEAEIFLRLIQEYSREIPGILIHTHGNVSTSDASNTLDSGLNRRKVHTTVGLMGGIADLRSIIIKGGGVLTLSKIYELLARKLSGKMYQEAAKYQIKSELIKKGGHMAAVNLESKVALLAAKQGAAGAATRYFGLRSMVTLLGPILWGTLLADVVIQMLGTDYTRILQAIYAFAQIRIIRTYKLPPE